MAGNVPVLNVSVQCKEKDIITGFVMLLRDAWLPHLLMLNALYFLKLQVWPEERTFLCRLELSTFVIAFFLCCLVWFVFALLL